MKHIATVALIFHFGAAGIYAQSGPLNVRLSGTAAASTINLLPGTTTSEYRLAGNAAGLGQLDLRVVSVSTPAPQRGTCSVNGSAVAGASVFRFDNGDLLTGILKEGSDCIDFSTRQAICIRVFNVTGGTGRFKNAAGGTITLTMTLAPVLGDASGNPVFFTVTGSVTGWLDQGPEGGQP